MRDNERKRKKIWIIKKAEERKNGSNRMGDTGKPMKESIKDEDRGIFLR